MRRRRRGLRLRALAARRPFQRLPPDAVSGIREHNALLFDFVLKRSLASGSACFPRGVFETQPFFFNPT